MANPNGRKGSQFERDVCEYLKANGFPYAERSPRWGAVDKGDLTGTAPYTFECKNVQKQDLSAFVEEARVERDNAGTEYPVVVLKRRQKSVDKSYVVMELAEFVRLVSNGGA